MARVAVAEVEKGQIRIQVEAAGLNRATFFRSKVYRKDRESVRT